MKPETKEKIERKRDQIKEKISLAKARMKNTRQNIRINVKKKVLRLKEKRHELIERFRTKKIKTADIFTLLNAGFGILCIFFSISQHFYLAATMLIFAICCDALDGKIARWTHKTSELGKELDSLADIVSFGVAPAVFAFMQNASTVAMIIYLIFVWCGIIRLARFNIQQTHIYFYGMPITINGYLTPILFFAGLPPTFWPWVFLPLSLLMIARFKIKKIQ
ncbi:CDP-diacylglycerol--serine O-phosphatidyltransferase [Candidatus Woesearchaeota archaeon]|nr:CDP-diacylglycerol--serine O-phosphatidyltransferase [Candidatus Woesearchaeota archaeon]